VRNQLLEGNPNLIGHFFLLNDESTLKLEWIIEIRWIREVELRINEHRSDVPHTILGRWIEPKVVVELPRKSPKDFFSHLPSRKRLCDPVK